MIILYTYKIRRSVQLTLYYLNNICVCVCARLFFRYKKCTFLCIYQRDPLKVQPKLSCIKDKVVFFSNRLTQKAFQLWPHCLSCMMCTFNMTWCKRLNYLGKWALSLNKDIVKIKNIFKATWIIIKLECKKDMHKNCSCLTAINDLPMISSSGAYIKPFQQNDKESWGSIMVKCNWNCSCLYKASERDPRVASRESVVSLDLRKSSEEYWKCLFSYLREKGYLLCKSKDTIPS